MSACDPHAPGIIVTHGPTFYGSVDEGARVSGSRGRGTIFEGGIQRDMEHGVVLAIAGRVGGLETGEDQPRESTPNTTPRRNAATVEQRAARPAVELGIEIATRPRSGREPRPNLAANHLAVVWETRP